MDTRWNIEETNLGIFVKQNTILAAFVAASMR